MDFSAVGSWTLEIRCVVKYDCTLRLSMPSSETHLTDALESGVTNDALEDDPGPSEDEMLIARCCRFGLVTLLAAHVLVHLPLANELQSSLSPADPNRIGSPAKQSEPVEMSHS